MAIIRVRPGVVTAQDGTYPELRGTRKGGLAAQDMGGRYEEASYRGAMFYAVNTAAQALSVASSTYTGLVVQNPLGSTKNLSLLEVIFATSIAVTGVGSVVMGWGGTTTAGVPVVLTTGNSSGPVGLTTLLGSSVASVAKVGASCTWSVNGAAAAPTILRPLIGVSWVTAGTTQTFSQYKDEIAGGLIVPPGAQVCIEAITTAITGFSYISWEEIAL
jgi:hypothetical protein